jgi:cytochrome c
MKLRLVLSSAGVSIMLAVACSALAAERSSAEEAKDLLNRAVSYVEKERPAKAFCAFNDPSGAFHKGPLYVFVINMDGVYFAHSVAARSAVSGQ